jgi:APA family basic amino acid/polyamine antiporter
MPTNASIAGVMLCGFWLLYFYGANLTAPWFGPFCFDTSELPIVTIYALYIPIFIMMMKKEKDFPAFKRFVAPTLALCGSLFMIVAACFSHRMAVVYYLIVFAVVMIWGAALQKKKEISD